MVRPQGSAGVFFQPLRVFIYHVLPDGSLPNFPQQQRWNHFLCLGSTPSLVLSLIYAITLLCCHSSPTLLHTMKKIYPIIFDVCMLSLFHPLRSPSSSLFVPAGLRPRWWVMLSPLFPLLLCGHSFCCHSVVVCQREPPKLRRPPHGARVTAE